MAIRFFDMFAGIGGFRSGLEAIGGFECIGHCEIDKYANQAYNAIYEPKGELYFEDARIINPNDLPELDLICAGFPCQSFSVAGKRLGFADDTRGTLFFEVARIAEAKRPAYLLLENVPGLLSHDGGRTLDTIFTALDYRAPKKFATFWKEEEQRSERAFRRKAETRNTQFATTRGMILNGVCITEPRKRGSANIRSPAAAQAAVHCRKSWRTKYRTDISSHLLQCGRS